MADRTVLLGVSGGIAAYKAADLASLLRKQGWDVHAILTSNATRFVTPLTFEALTRHPAYVDAFAAGEAIRHIELARKADVVAVVPASADVLAKMACGIADDLLTTTLLATTAPIVVAPAMNVEMWRHGATQDNLATLRRRGVEIVDPASGELACGEVGEGRLADPTEIASRLEAVVLRAGQLAGRRVVVTAGGTREPIDPVRYLGNRSSGKMGHALAAEAARRGAEVVLITSSSLAPPPGVEVMIVETAAQMAGAVLGRLPRSDVLVMAAAVADWKASTCAPAKLKKSKGPPVIEFEPTVDILAEAGRVRRPGQLLIGFAAETEDLLDYARAKLEAKNADLVVANDAVSAMEAEDNAVVVLDRQGIVADLARRPKTALAGALWDVFASHLPGASLS